MKSRMSTDTVSSGATSSGLTVTSGNALNVLSGGTVLSATVDSGGGVALSSGAVASAVIVSAGGAMTGPGDLEGVVDWGQISGGLIAATYVPGYGFSGGVVQVQSGGSISGVTVADGYLYVSSGGVASGALGHRPISGIPESGTG